MIDVTVSIEYNPTLDTIYYWCTGEKPKKITDVAESFILVKNKLKVKTIFAKYIVSELHRVINFGD